MEQKYEDQVAETQQIHAQIAEKERETEDLLS